MVISVAEPLIEVYLHAELTVPVGSVCRPISDLLKLHSNVGLKIIHQIQRELQ